MYDEALLKELTELENTVRFDSFDFNDAYALAVPCVQAGEKAPKPIAVRIVLDGMILYQSFLPGHRRHQQQLDGQEAAHCAADRHHQPARRRGAGAVRRQGPLAA